MKYSVVLVLLVLCGCVSRNYDTHFVENEQAKEKYVHHQPKAQLYRGGSQKEDARKLIENGYVMIGHASFVAEEHNPKLALKKAKSIGAAIVIHYSNSAGATSTLMPLTLPTSTTSTTISNSHQSGRVSGTVGSQPVAGNYSGVTRTTSTTISSSSNTTFIPITIRWSEVLATYWAKAKGTSFGAVYDNVPSKTSKQIGRNGGVVLQVIVQGSPAYLADFFEGDVILQVNGERIHGAEHFSDILASNKGQAVELSGLRGGESFVKKVSLK